ncbi:MAG: hypothetical protein JHD00_06760 [Akkermansiaceae bacterium]|nr:hypothetical protein [Akkermansiaceae bacterium]
MAEAHVANAAWRGFACKPWRRDRRCFGVRATIEQEDTALTAIKKQRNETPKLLTYSESPEASRFLNLVTRSKHSSTQSR